MVFLGRLQIKGVLKILLLLGLARRRYFIIVSLCYYEYILLYTDDTLVVSDNAEQVLRQKLGRYFELKKDSIRPPNIYLGGHVRKMQLDNGVKAWSYSSSRYVRSAVKNVEAYLAK